MNHLTTHARRLAAGIVAAATAVSGFAGLIAPAANAAPLPTCGVAGTPTLSMMSDLTFHLNSGEQAFANYLGIKATADTAIANLWLKASDFTGDSVALGAGQPAAQPSGALAAGATIPSYFLAVGQAESVNAQPFTITAYDGNPDLVTSTPLCTFTSQFDRVDDTITAQANKVDEVTATATGTTIGATATVTAVGYTGVIGSGPAYDPGVINLAPVTSVAFPAGAWRLTKVEFTYDNGTVIDQLHLENQEAVASNYTAVYTFTAVGTSSAPAPVAPVQFIASGTQVKKTPLSAISGSLPSLPAVVNGLTIAKTADTPVLTNAGGQVTYTVTVSNASTESQALDDIIDTIPAGATYVTGSATQGGNAAADPVIASGQLTMVGPWTVPAEGSITFGYTLDIPATEGEYTNTVIGHSGSAVIDASTDTANNTPATATVTVAAPGPVVDPASGSTTGVTPVSVTPTVTGTGIDPTKACLIDPADSVCRTTVTTADGTYVVNNDGSVTFTPTAPFVGTTAAVDYRATDQYGQKATGPVTFTVAAPAGPTVDPAAVSTTGVTPVSVTPTANGTSIQRDTSCLIDPADSVCKATFTTAQGTWEVDNTGKVTFTANSTFTGTAGPVDYRVADIYGQTATGGVTVTVNAPVGPAVDPATGTTTGITPVSVTPAVTGTGIDPTKACLVDPADSTCKKTVTTAQGTWVVNNDGSVTFTAVLGFSGTAGPLPYQATDQYGQTGQGNVTITVAKPAGPAVDPASKTVAYNTAATVSPSATGAGIDPTQACVINAATACVTSWTVAAGTWTVANDGAVTFTPLASYPGGTVTATYQVTDAYGQTATNTVSITVGTPGAPEMDPIVDSTPYRTAITVDPAPTGANIDPATACIVDPADSACKASVTIADEGTWTVANDGTVTFTPVDGFAGAATVVTYKVSNTSNEVGSTTITIDVAYPAEPTASNEAAVVDEGTTATLIPEVTGTDIDDAATCLVYAGTCSTSPVVVAGEGTWEIQPDGSITFTPLTGYHGVATSVDYRVTDRFGRTADGTLSVIVNQGLHVNGPVEMNERFAKTAKAKVTATGPGALNMCIEDGVQCLKVVKTAEGTWRIDDAGNVSFTPAPCFNGTAGPRTVRVTSGDLTAQTLVTATIGAPSARKRVVKVYFNVSSPTVGSSYAAQLRRAAAAIPSYGCQVKVRAVGFVQATPFTGNDTTLSTARARNAVKVLKAAGLKGRITVSGLGRATESGGAARRAEVTITWLG